MEQLISHAMHESRSAWHELVVVRILVFAPMSVDADLLDADDWAIFHASTRAAAANAHGWPALSASGMQTGASAHRRDARFAIKYFAVF